MSTIVYDLTVGSEFMTAGGKQPLNDAIRNFNNEPDMQFALHGGRTPFERPASGVNDVVAII